MMNEYGKLAKKDFDPGNEDMNWLVEEFYPDIRNGQAAKWNEIWEEMKEKRPHIKKDRRKPKKKMNGHRTCVYVSENSMGQLCKVHPGNVVSIGKAGRKRNIRM